MGNKIESQITFLATGNLAKTATFYEQIIGLRLVLDQGTCHIYEVSENAFIGFCERDQTTTSDDIILTFVTSDVDGLSERLKANGAKIEQGPTYNPQYKIYHCFLRDPNGYRLEIQRFEDPRWNK